MQAVAAVRCVRSAGAANRDDVTVGRRVRTGLAGGRARARDYVADCRTIATRGQRVRIIMRARRSRTADRSRSIFVPHVFTPAFIRRGETPRSAIIAIETGPPVPPPPLNG